MKTAAIAILSTLGAASAFIPQAPVTRMARGRAMKMSFEAEAGVTAPLGYWDPLGFSADGDAEKFAKYRAIEIKHGRIAQLAMLHTIVTYFYKLPGSLGDVPIDSIPYGIDALKVWPTAGIAQVLLFCSALEILAPQKEDKLPGDVQPDTPAFKKFEDKSEDEAMDYSNKEINNGRLAMIAWTGATVGAALTGGEHPITTLLEKLS